MRSPADLRPEIPPGTLDLLILQAVTRGPLHGYAIADEFELHVQQCAEQLQREGLSPASARLEAERRFGDIARHHEACRREAPEERVNSRARMVLFAAVVAEAAAIAALVWRQDRSIAEFRHEVDALKSRARVQAIDSPSVQAVQRGSWVRASPGWPRWRRLAARFRLTCLCVPSSGSAAREVRCTGTPSLGASRSAPAAICRWRGLRVDRLMPAAETAASAGIRSKTRLERHEAG